MSLFLLGEVRVKSILGGRGSVRDGPIHVLRSVVFVEEVHKSDDFFVVQVEQSNLNRVSLHAQRNVVFLFFSFHHRGLQKLSQLLELILVLCWSDELLVVLLDLAQLFELVHDLLEMAAALSGCSCAEEGSEGFENSE